MLPQFARVRHSITARLKPGTGASLDSPFMLLLFRNHVLSLFFKYVYTFFNVTPGDPGRGIKSIIFMLAWSHFVNCKVISNNNQAHLATPPGFCIRATSAVLTASCQWLAL